MLPLEICIPDGEAHVFGGRLYVYGSYDTSSKEYCSEEYHVASTDDMLAWKVGGKSLDGRDVPWPNDKHCEAGRKKPYRGRIGREW